MIAFGRVKLRITYVVFVSVNASNDVFLFWGQHFDTETQDLFGIEWAPNGCVLAVWDTCLEV